MTIPMVMLGFGSSGGGVIRRIISNTQEYNLFTSIGSPTGPVSVQLIIESGIYVWSDNVTIPALNFGPLPAGSKVKITNHGFIMGRGGDGANAGGVVAAAQIGGNAINATCEITIDNTDGYILGGGGGGGGVVLPFSITGGGPGPYITGGGGGAGGGRGGNSNGGFLHVAGGLGGAVGLKGADGAASVGGFQSDCAAGGGGRIAVGTGGVGAFTFDNGTNPTKAFGGQCGGGGGVVCDESNSHGGTGGANTTNGGNGVREGGSNEAAAGGGAGWGMKGGDAVTTPGGTPGPTLQPGAVGGKAVNLNGNTIIWMAGSASPRVQGAVS